MCLLLGQSKILEEDEEEASQKQQSLLALLREWNLEDEAERLVENGVCEMEDLEFMKDEDADRLASSGNGDGSRLEMHFQAASHGDTTTSELNPVSIPCVIDQRYHMLIKLMRHARS